MNKQYRLLKDLPQCKAGTIFEKNQSISEYYKAVGIHKQSNGLGGIEFLYIDYHLVENSPDWFQPIKDEPVRVCHFEKGNSGVNSRQWYNLNLSRSISDEEITKVKQAIEQALNSNGEDTDILPTDFLKEFDNIEVGDYLMPSKEFVALFGKLKNFYVKIKQFDHAAKWRMVEHSLTASRNSTTSFF